MIVVALVYPWISSRIAANKSISNIFSEHLIAHTEAISGGVQEFLSQYEVPSRFLIGVIEDPYLIDCTEEKVYQFIRYCKASRKNLQPRPSVFFLGQNQSTTNGPRFCFINWNTTSEDEDDFQFFYLLTPQTADLILIKHFSGLTTDFSNFDSFTMEGEIFDFTDKFNSLFISQHSTFQWTNPFVSLPLITNPLLTGSLYARKNDSTAIASVISGIGLDFDYLFTTLSDIASLSQCHYALMDLNGNVLITDAGKIYVNHTSDSQSDLYPSLKELNSTFWSSVADLEFDLVNHTIISESIDNSIYLLMSTYISVRDQPQFQLIVAFDLENSLSDIFYNTSLIFIIAVVLLSIIFFGISCCSRKATIERARKLKRIPTLQDDKFNIDKNSGVLLNSIHSLRRLQLAYPEDSMLNKITDSAVLNLAQSKNALFCKPISSPNGLITSEFSEAIQHKLEHKEPAKAPFMVWKKTIGRNLCQDIRIVLDYQWPESENPIIIVRQIVWLIVQHDLLFAEIDPDGLIKFIKMTAESMNSPSSTSLRINYFAYLISNTLKNSLQTRIDILAVALSVALIHSVAEENYCKRVKKINNVLNSFDQIVPGQGPTRDYLRETVRELLMSTDDKHVFDLIGEFALISESPEFSISDNYDHHQIFMKALVKLCDFSPYWAPNATMLKALEAESTLGDVSNSFRFNYEYVVASTIVSPLMNDFANITKMDEISNNFKENLEYLARSASIKE